MKNDGISLIVIDDIKELPSLAKQLHVDPDQLVSLAYLEDTLSRIFEVVFFVVYNGEAAECYMEAFNIRRGIVVAKGKRQCFGRDLNWVKATLSSTTRNLDNDVTAVKPASLNLCREMDQPSHEGGCHLLPEEKDDPHADLGYTRR